MGNATCRKTIDDRIKGEFKRHGDGLGDDEPPGHDEKVPRGEEEHEKYQNSRNDS